MREKASVPEKGRKGLGDGTMKPPDVRKLQVGLSSRDLRSWYFELVF